MKAFADIHVVPNYPDEPEHDLHAGCWCHPDPINTREVEIGMDDKIIWSHNRRAFN